MNTEAKIILCIALVFLVVTQCQNEQKENFAASKIKQCAVKKALRKKRRSIEGFGVVVGGIDISTYSVEELQEGIRQLTTFMAPYEYQLLSLSGQAYTDMVIFVENIATDIAHLGQELASRLGSEAGQVINDALAGVSANVNEALASINEVTNGSLYDIESVMADAASFFEAQFGKIGNDIEQGIGKSIGSISLNLGGF